LVEAIETLFVPVMIHNNVGGSDGKVAQQFKEPTWNNPVTRFVDATGEDVIPRKDGVWSASAMAARMEEALSKAPKSKAPTWFVGVSQDLAKKDGVAHDTVPLPAPYKYLPMTQGQRTRLSVASNDLITLKKTREDILSPRQLELLASIEKSLKHGGKKIESLLDAVPYTDIASAFDEVQKITSKRN
jgi:hypothetical protein